MVNMLRSTFAATRCEALVRKLCYAYGHQKKERYSPVLDLHSSSWFFLRAAQPFGLNLSCFLPKQLLITQVSVQFARRRFSSRTDPSEPCLSWGGVSDFRRLILSAAFAQLCWLGSN